MCLSNYTKGWLFEQCWTLLYLYWISKHFYSQLNFICVQTVPNGYAFLDLWNMKNGTFWTEVVLIPKAESRFRVHLTGFTINSVCSAVLWITAGGAEDCSPSQSGTDCFLTESYVKKFDDKRVGVCPGTKSLAFLYFWIFSKYIFYCCISTLKLIVDIECKVKSTSFLVKLNIQIRNIVVYPSFHIVK